MDHKDVVPGMYVKLTHTARSAILKGATTSWVVHNSTRQQQIATANGVYKVIGPASPNSVDFIVERPKDCVLALNKMEAE